MSVQYAFLRYITSLKIYMYNFITMYHGIKFYFLAIFLADLKLKHIMRKGFLNKGKS